jgi:hypothetical protein
MPRAHHSIARFDEDDLPPADTEVDAIDCLYLELSDLYAQRESSPTDRQLEDRIAETFRRLRAAQAEEVVRLKIFFESGLRMPLGAGAELLRQVREMRGSRENSSAGNPASRTADNP